MIVLGSDFWVCLLLGVCFVFVLCFLSGFLESVIAVCFLFYWPAQLMCSQACLMVLEAGWDDLGKGSLGEKDFAICW